MPGLSLTSLVLVLLSLLQDINESFDRIAVISIITQ